MPFHFPFPIKGNSTPSQPDIDWKRKIQEKAFAPVSPPVPNPIPSYWVPGPCELYRDGKLPLEVDIVIVGSGISGALIARNLLKNNRTRSILMLEARDVCSGATARNGGHTKGAVYFGYDNPGEDNEVLKIIALEEANIAGLHSLAHELDIDVGQEECDTLDIFYTPESWQSCQNSIHKLMADTVSQPVALHTMYSKDEFPKERNCFTNMKDRKVHGFVQYKAGRMTGYKLVRKVLGDCVDKGLQIITQCPVTGLKKTGNGLWEVSTSRGAMSTKKVVLATNGYTGGIHPAFHKVVFPVRGDVVAIRAGSEIEKKLPSRSMSFIYTEEDFDYMVVQPKEDLNNFEGLTFVLGGGLSRGADGVLPNFGNTDDSTVNKKTQNYLKDLLPQAFGQAWGNEYPDGTVRIGWSGVMGFTVDQAPLVGQVPGEEGLWASVGFQGHGMAMALKCAEAVVDMIDGKDKDGELEWFPKSWWITPERLQTDEFWKRFVE